jgi:hypothetical protein
MDGGRDRAARPLNLPLGLMTCLNSVVEQVRLPVIPERCRLNHPWGPGLVTIEWLECECPAAEFARGGHITARKPGKHRDTPQRTYALRSATIGPDTDRPLLNGALSLAEPAVAKAASTTIIVYIPVSPLFNYNPGRLSQRMRSSLTA